MNLLISQLFLVGKDPIWSLLSKIFSAIFIYAQKKIIVMKTNTGVIVLGISLVVAAGLFGANVSGMIFHNTIQSQPAANALFTGHVETVVKDSQGNVKEYRQSDNVITNTGETCAARLLFNLENVGSNGGGPASSVCRGALTASFTTIGLGSGSTGANGTQTALATEYTSFGLDRAGGASKTVTFTNATTGGPSATVFAATDAAQVVIQSTFTNTDTVSHNVAESGLFNSTAPATSGMFARQTFSAISMAPQDQLTVKWTINIGSTSKFIS